MITFRQIKLRGMGMLNEESMIQLAASYIDAMNLGVDALGGLYAYDAFLVITSRDDINPTNYEELMAFKGFLNAELKLDGDDLLKYLWPILEALHSDNAVTKEDILCLTHEPVGPCREQYLSLSPSLTEIEHYQSLFQSKDLNKPIFIDFGDIRSSLNEADITFFIELLAAYLVQKNYDEGQPLGSAICGLMKGLVTRNPGIRLSELRLDEESSESFIRCAEYTAVDQALKAGYSTPMAFANRGIIRDLISEFFVTNGFITHAN